MGVSLTIFPIKSVFKMKLASVATSMRSSLLIMAWWRHKATDILASIGSGNGLVPVRRQAITWISADLLFIRTPGTNFNDILFDIKRFSFEKMHWKISSAKYRPYCSGLAVLNNKCLAPNWFYGRSTRYTMLVVKYSRWSWNIDGSRRSWTG